MRTHESRSGFILAFLFSLFIIVCGAISANAAKSEDERLAEVKKMIAEKGYHWTAGRTSVSGLSEEEFKKLCGLIIPPESELKKQNIPVITAPEGATYPVVFDWRDMEGTTPAKNQGACGSCWAFAAVGQLEAHVRIYDGRLEDLSEQQILSCNTTGGSCAGGYWTDAYGVFDDPGAVTESCMPYQASDGVTCIEGQCQIRGRISDYYEVSNDINSIKEALQSGPVWTGICATYDLVYYTSGCFDTPTYDPINHAVLIVGWDDTQCSGEGAWIIKNSWEINGLKWGIDGYGYIKYGIASIGAYTHQINYESTPIQPILVGQPNGGEGWVTGSQHAIRWTAESYPNIDHFQVGYYAGTSYYLIANAAANVRKIQWTVPNAPYDECLLQICSITPNHDVGHCDMGDGYFTILGPRTEWSSAGVPICAAAGSQSGPSIISDGTKGAIISFYDERRVNGQINARKIGANGDLLWPDTPISIGTTTAEVLGQRMVPDGAGGAIVAWYDNREGNNNIYAQRIGPNAEVLWAAQGIAVCTAAGEQEYPEIASDGAGGAVIAWNNQVGSEQSEIYAQRVSKNGVCSWSQNGILVASVGTSYPQFALAPDGSNGAFVAWMDDAFAIRLQRVNSGTVMWAANATVCDGPNPVYFEMINDGAGHAIVTWIHGSVSDRWNNDVYAQKCDGTGAMLWAAGGVGVCTATGDQFISTLTSDGSGGAIIAWFDAESYYCENTCDLNVYAQRVASSGDVQWTANGVEIASGFKSDHYSSCTLSVTHDDEGGAFVVWSDSRDGVYNTSIQTIDNWDIYAQRINSDGVVQWYQNGEPVCVTLTNQRAPVTNVNHDGSIIIAWHEPGSDGHYDVRAQKLLGNYSSVPRCEVTAEILRGGTSYKPSETFLFGCPAGDRGDVLKITCDFNDEDVSNLQEITPADIGLDTFGLPFSFCGPILGSVGTTQNGYVVTLTREYINGCSGCEGAGCRQNNCPVPGMPVTYNGNTIGAVYGLKVKSMDVTGDGKFNLSDLAGFGPTYYKKPGDTGYNSCYDYNGDGPVNLSDFAFLGAHYQHHCPAPSPSSPNVAKSPLSDVKVRFVVAQSEEMIHSDKIRVAVFVDNASDVSALCMGLDNDNPSFEFSGWTPNPELQAACVALPKGEDDVCQLFIAGFNMESLDGTSAELGVLEYQLTNDGGSTLGSNASPAFAEDGLVLKLGEIIDLNGNIKRISGVESENEALVYRNYLADNYPNPFNPVTTIEYSIKESGHVSLKVYNVSGQLVTTLVNEVQDRTGVCRSVRWDGQNEAGEPVASGVYFYRLVTNGFEKTKKMVLLK